MLHKIFDINLVAVFKVTLKLNKPAYIGMCFVELTKVLMDEFHYNYIKVNMTINQNYCSQTLIFYCMKLKLKKSMKI